MAGRLRPGSATSGKIAAALLLSLFVRTGYAGTILESHNTLYNLNVIGFFHLDIADFKVDPVGDAGLPIDEGFQEAKGVAHFSSRLGQRFSAFLETELSVSENKNELHIERVLVKYDIDNISQFSIGRFHAPVGFWNQHYHHGRWLQMSKDRPVQSEFGGTFLPGHYWGAMYERRVSMPNRVISLDIGLGAGRDGSLRVPGYPRLIGSESSFMAQINVAPAKKRGLNFGGSVWLGDLHSEAAVDDADEQIFTAHINFQDDSREFLFEVATVRHDYADARSTASNYSFYLQYGQRLAAFEGRLQPYFRVERVDLDRADLVFSGIQSNDRGTLGLRLDASERSAIKLEVRHDRFPDSHQSINSIQAQYATYYQ